MRNIRIVIEYDGTEYCGWQRQPNGTSIQEVLESAISSIVQERIRLIGSGRTDAGVHAIHQVANFMSRSSVQCSGLLRGLNSLLPQDITVKDAQDVEEQFHSRYSAQSKVYLYRIYNCPTRSALEQRYAWHIREMLDFETMNIAVGMLLGTHDFASFCASGSDSANHVRTITSACVRKIEKNHIETVVEASGFLRHMMRNIVGTIVDVGKGRLSIDDFRRIFEARDRTLAGITAPPQGLYLKDVKYR